MTAADDSQDIAVSVLIPTRDRIRPLHDSVHSLLSNAEDSRRVEFLLAIDPDIDHEITYPSAASVTIWTAPERYGYARLHEYYNHLATLARGTWLLLWNDDAIMLSKGWDAVIASQPPSVLWLQANHHETGNLFPAWPRAWTDEAGYVSLSPNVDRWVSEIGRALNAERRIQVRVQHDRADITGRNRDQTYLEGRHLMGDADHPDFNSAENIAARYTAIAAIAGLL